MSLPPVAPAARLAPAAALVLLALAAPPRVRAAAPAESFPHDRLCGLPAFLADSPERRARFEVHRGLKRRTEAARFDRERLEAGRLRAAPPDSPGLGAVGGTVAFPVLLGSFPEAAPAVPASAFQAMLFGTWPTGTLTQYFEETSYGALHLTGDVVEWHRVQQNAFYYAGDTSGLGTDAHVDEFIHELLDNADATVDFRIYDNDGPDGVPDSGDDDGFVDFIGVIHADIGGEYGTGGIWSHRSRLAALTAGIHVTGDIGHGGLPIRVDDYTIMSAYNSAGMQREIGVFAHEVGHAFGLPDLYDTKDDVTGKSAGIGAWGIMGTGTWGHPESPPHFCAWSKQELGWIVPGVVTQDLFHWPVASSSQSPTAFRMWTGGSANTPEYFLVEYRRRVGFDQWLPADGVLVWHIKENNFVPYGSSLNGDERFKRVDLECADQFLPDHLIDVDHLDQFGSGPSGNQGDAGDMWCQSAGIFGPATEPSSVSYGGVDTGVIIRVTSPCGATSVNVSMTVGNIAAGSDLCVRDCTTDTCLEPSACGSWWASPEIWIDNNADGVIDPPTPGLPNRFFARVTNQGTAPAVAVKVDLYEATPTAGLTFPGPTSTLVETGTIDLIGPLGDTKTVSFEHVIPIPPADVDHYCYGVVVSTSVDPPLSADVPAENNLAQINVQELYAKAGETPPTAEPNRCAGEGHDLRMADVFTAKRRVQLCNTLPDLCGYTVRIGSPPAFDDAVIPDDWTVQLSTVAGTLLPGQCLPLDVTVTDTDAHHLDFAVVPITLMCGTQPVGGTVLKFHIDNFPPRVDCAMFAAVRQVPPGTDHLPQDEAVRVEWDEALLDSMGHPERVARWAVHRGKTPSFLPTGSNRLLETCLDGDPRTPRYDAAAGLPLDPDETWYRIISTDRAGNSTASCAFQAAAPPASGAPEAFLPARLALAAPRPNPFDGATTIRFDVPTGGARAALDVHDVAGRRVRTLLDGHRDAGTHAVTWDGTDADGAPVGAGIYFVRLGTDRGDALTRKVIRSR